MSWVGVLANRSATLPDEPVPIERALTARARSGDPAAFRRLYELHLPAVRRLCHHLLGDRELAREAAQETFVRAHRGLPALPDGDALRPWLFGILRNVCREQLRARRRSLRAEPVEAIDRQPPPIDDPEALLIGCQADRALAAGLAGLDADRRAVLMMRLDGDLSYDDIARAMGWPLHKVKNEIHKARLALRAALASHLGGER